MFIYPGNCYSVLQLYTYLPAGRDGRTFLNASASRVPAFMDSAFAFLLAFPFFRVCRSWVKFVFLHSQNARSSGTRNQGSARPSLPTNRYYLGTNRKPWNKNHRLLIVCIRWLGEHLITPLFPSVGPQIFLRGQQIKNAQGTGMGLLNYV